MEPRLHGHFAPGGHLHDAAHLLWIVIDVLEALLGFHEVIDGRQRPLGHEPSQRELDVVPGSAHRRRDRNAVGLDLQRLLDGEGVGPGIDDSVAPPQHAASVGRGHGFPFAGGRLSLGVDRSRARRSTGGSILWNVRSVVARALPMHAGVAYP